MLVDMRCCARAVSHRYAPDKRVRRSHAIQGTPGKHDVDRADHVNRRCDVGDDDCDCDDDDDDCDDDGDDNDGDDEDDEYDAYGDYYVVTLFTACFPEI